VRACRRLYETCRAYGVPLVSGKDSMKNEAVLGGVKICVPPTLLVSALGQIDDVRGAVTLDFKMPGDLLYVAGTTGGETGGSEYLRLLGERDGLEPEDGGPAPYVGTAVPDLDPEATLPLYRAFHDAIRAGIVRSASAPALGGLGAALARACLAGRLGAELELAACPGAAEIEDDVALFAETGGRLLFTVAPADAKALEALFDGLPLGRVGTVREQPTLTVRRAGSEILATDVDALLESYQEGLAHA
jgi:phosphoribosylformylglycinamidine synthase